MGDKPYSISRAILHSERLDSPEHEIAIDQSWRQDSGIPDPSGYGASVHIPWNRIAHNLHRRDLTARDLSDQSTIGVDVIGVRDSLRPTSLIMKFPITLIEGLNGVSVFPRISTGVSASQASEIATLTESDPVFGAAGGSARRIAVTVTVSKQLLAQAVNSPSFDAFLARELTRSLNQKIDNNILNSTDGLLNNPILAQSSAWVAASGWGQILTVQKALEDAFVDQDNMGWLLGTSAASNWRQIGKGSTTSFFIYDQITNRVNGIYTYVTSHIGSTSYQTVLADWSNMVIGFWGTGLDIVYDPYSAASTGEVVLTAMIYFNAWAIRPTTFQVAGPTSIAFTS